MKTIRKAVVGAMRLYLDWTEKKVIEERDVEVQDVAHSPIIAPATTEEDNNPVPIVNRMRELDCEILELLRAGADPLVDRTAMDEIVNLKTTERDEKRAELEAVLFHVEFGRADEVRSQVAYDLLVYERELDALQQEIEGRVDVKDMSTREKVEKLARHMKEAVGDIERAIQLYGIAKEHGADCKGLLMMYAELVSNYVELEKAMTELQLELSHDEFHELEDLFMSLKGLPQIALDLTV